MIGLDIGTYSIKAVELQKKDDSTTLVNFHVQARAQKEGLSGALERFFQEGNFTSKDIAIAFSGHAVVARLVEMPMMKDEELKNAIRFEVEKNIPFKIDEALLDYQVISSTLEAKKSKILFAAVKEALVRDYIETIHELGFQIKCVDVDAIALTNAFLNANTENAEKSFILINAGNSYSNISIVSSGIPFLVRDISGSGREAAEAIAKGMGLSIEEAYKIKHNCPADKQDALLDMVRPTMDKLARELRLSVGYFENQYARGIEAIYVSGGSSRLHGLSDFLSEFLGIKVENWDPFKTITIGENVTESSLKEANSQLAVCAGLAARDD